MVKTKKSTAATKTKNTTRAKAMGVASNWTFSEWFAKPAVRYVAGGIATAALAKLAMAISERYPQVSQLLTEGIETMESKLTDFYGGTDSGTMNTTTRTRRSAAAGMGTH